MLSRDCGVSAVPEEGAVPTGPGDVLDLIRHGRATTRGDVLEVTGLSRMTIASGSTRCSRRG